MTRRKKGRGNDDGTRPLLDLAEAKGGDGGDGGDDGAIRPLLDLAEAKARRDEGIHRVDKHAKSAFAVLADAAVREAARKHPELLVDDVWQCMDRRDTTLTHDLRAMGPVMLRAAKAGILEKTNIYRESAQPSCHANPRRVWRSRVYQGIDKKGPGG